MLVYGQCHVHLAGCIPRPVPSKSWWTQQRAQKPDSQKAFIGSSCSYPLWPTGDRIQSLGGWAGASH